MRVVPTGWRLFMMVNGTSHQQASSVSFYMSPFIATIVATVIAALAISVIYGAVTLRDSVRTNTANIAQLYSTVATHGVAIKARPRKTYIKFRITALRRKIGQLHSSLQAVRHSIQTLRRRLPSGGYSYPPNVGPDASHHPQRHHRLPLLRTALWML